MVYVAIVLFLALLGSLYLNYLWIKAVLSLDEVQGTSPESQSEVYEGMKLHDSHFKETKDPDTTEEETEVVNVAIYNNVAYWIADVGLVQAPLDEEEEVMYSLQKQVDVHSMTTKEVDMLMEILDALKEASDEGTGSGK